MAIQMRRGANSDFIPSKMLPGEFAVTTDGSRKAYVAFQANDVKELEFKEDIKVTAEKIKEALGYMQNGIDAANERVILLETMVLNNEFAAPMITDDDNLTVITDDNGNAILADWKHKEV